MLVRHALQHRVGRETGFWYYAPQRGQIVLALGENLISGNEIAVIWFPIIVFLQKDTRTYKNYYYKYEYDVRIYINKINLDIFI